MKLALACPEDFKRAWSVYRNAQRISQEYSPFEIDDALTSMHVRGSNPTRLKRCLAVILGQLDYSAAYMRVVHGCELLIEHCQDPAEDVYALKPEITQGYEDTARLDWMIAHQAQLLTHETSNELRFIHNGTLHFHGSGDKNPRELIESAMAFTANLNQAAAPAEASDVD